MTELPTEQRVQPIVDVLAADAEALVELGVLEPQPEPAVSPTVVLPNP